ncbi:class A beta-lactamase [Nitrobacter sp. NHB1]|uniref:class A beta-lactamase n=1 Tax=Nitrobacter sp. NHB1 TaxID=3119830 RepID=UPI0030006A56
MIGRRRLLRAAGAGLVGLVVMGRAGRARAAAVLQQRFVDELKRLETESGGRLGVALLDTGTGQCVGHRMDERFPMCSTFKVLASGAVLHGVDAGKESLARRIYFSEADLVAHSPETHERVGPVGITVAELCKAAITLSDNTAGNLLLASLGGPQGLTAFVRKLGDDVTRLDRIETALNEAAPGDPRDTTTPNAMASDLRALVVGDVLSTKSRAQLVAWLAANTTGSKRLRAGLPAGWRAGDKTGTGERGTANDVAVVWPPDRAPMIVTAYLTGAAVSADRQNAVMAAVGRAVTTALA